jgi:hypothetical protein
MSGEWRAEPLALVCEPVGASLLQVALVRGAGFFPYQVLLFSSYVSFFDATAFVTFASYAFLALPFVLMQVAADAFAVERGAHYPAARCGATRFAFPDAQFVTSVAYVLALAVSVARHRVYSMHVSPLRTAVMALYLCAYFAATVVSGYFTLGLLAANLALALVLAALGTALFCWLEAHVWRTASDAMRARIRLFGAFLGVSISRARARRKSRHKRSSRANR